MSMSAKGDIFVLVGPPGSGKGSFSGLCIKNFGWKQLSTGNLCRKQIAQQTEIGKQIDLVLKSGKLVNDGIIVDMVNQWLAKQLGRDKSILLDGYPRNLAQAKALDDFLKQEEFKDVGFYVVRLVVSDDVVVNRLGGRAVCQNKDCHAVYSIIEGSELRSKNNKMCDLCESPLEIRNDDEPEAIKERLKVYHENESALLGFYKDKGQLVFEIDASMPLDEVFDSFKKMAGLEG
ncbi:adenylate kinase family protein [Candidatus Dependentiae bacterium]